MKPLFSVYAWAAPLLLAPLSAWLWYRELQGQWAPLLVAWAMPVLWAYIVPGVGTNVLKVWEFDVRLRLGRFRPQHGFVFGSATSMLAWAVHGAPAQGWGDVARQALVLASVLGFWNLLYDVRALQAGVLKVYNQPWADGQPAEAVAMDYAPWFFAGFGAVYGASLGLAEWQLQRLQSPLAAGLVLAGSLSLACALPVAGYVAQSRRRHGHNGTRPVPRRSAP